MTRLKTIAYVEGLGEVVETCNNFYSELRQLDAGRARLISPRDEAYARLQTRGKEEENIGQDYGTRTSADFEYVKGEFPILRLKSRLLNQALAKKAVEANKQGNYFHTETTKEYEQSLEEAEREVEQGLEPKERSVIVLPSRDRLLGITDKQNWEVLEAVLKDQAKPYFEFNGPLNIYPFDKEIVDAQNGTIETLMVFGDFCHGSGFFGDRHFNYVDRARGVRKNL